MPLVPPYIEALRPYEAGRSIEEVQRAYGLSRISKLASNENPLGPSPLALEAMARSMNEPAPWSLSHPARSRTKRCRRA